MFHWPIYFRPHFLLSFWDFSKTQMRFLCIFYESYPFVQYFLSFSSSSFYFHSLLWTIFSSSLMLTSHLSNLLNLYTEWISGILFSDSKTCLKRKKKPVQLFFKSALLLFYINSFYLPTIIYYLCFCFYYLCFCFSTC